MIENEKILKSSNIYFLLKYIPLCIMTLIIQVISISLIYYIIFIIRIKLKGFKDLSESYTYRNTLNSIGNFKIIFFSCIIMIFNFAFIISDLSRNIYLFNLILIYPWYKWINSKIIVNIIGFKLFE